MDLRALQLDPAAFRAQLLIDCDGSPKRLGACLDDWQAADFEAIDPALRRVVGQDVQAKMRAYFERPRGHSKTSDIAVSASWILFASRRKLAGVCAAADADQAKLVLGAVDSLRRLNPWLGAVLEVTASKIRNTHTGSEIAVISSDVGSSYGLLPDVVICDELTHWPRREFFDSLISSAAKRASCLLLIIANAGFEQHWARGVRESIRTDPSWVFSRLEGPQASWITAERLAEQRRLLPPAAFERLWLNRWSTGAGDALESADIDASISLQGPADGAEQGWAYCAGLDLGLKRDSSALVIIARHVGYMTRTVRQPKPLAGVYAALSDLDYVDAPKPEIQYRHVEGTGQLRLACVRVWTPTSGQRVELEAVEAEIRALHERFRFCRLLGDPWQGEFLYERLNKAGIYCEPTPFSGPNLTAMAQAVLDSFRERQLQLFDHPELLADLRALRIAEKQYGFKLEPGKSTGGTAHGDSAVALSLALLGAKSIRGESTLSTNRQLVYN